MGLFSWFSGKPVSRLTGATQTAAHPSMADATRPFTSTKQTAPVPGNGPVTARSTSQRQEQRRTERNARRDLLFQIVRESMVRVGVLSSAFKFKVLALDQRGNTFLVMMELSAEFAGEVEKLAEIESLICRSAKNRYELAVQAVYWRFYQAVSAAPAPRAAGANAPAPIFGMHSNSRPAPLSATPYPNSRPAPLSSVPYPDSRPYADSSPYPDSGPVPLSATPYPKPGEAAARAAPVARSASLEAIHNKLLLTGYEETEMVDPDAPILSATQYGDLR